jgi:hypothetical protein
MGESLTEQYRVEEKEDLWVVNSFSQRRILTVSEE